MARQKNRGYQEFSPSYSTPTRTARRWKMASYIRLSKEDLQKIKKGLDCSNSVKNQRDILNYFYQSHVEEFERVTEYVDACIILEPSQEVLARQGFPVWSYFL